MGKTMLDSSHPCVVETVEVAAACFFFRASAMGIIPGFHGNAHHFIPLFMEHEGCDGTVDTAAHGYQNFSFPAHKKLLKRGAKIRRGND
jgi:hypothetical protein